MFKKGKILLVIAILLMCSSFYFSSVDNSTVTMFTRVGAGLCVLLDFALFKRWESEQTE